MKDYLDNVPPMNCVTAGVTSEGVARVRLDMPVDYCSVVGSSHPLHAAVYQPVPPPHCQVASPLLVLVLGWVLTQQSTSLSHLLIAR